ncbi:unnamed protein product [Rhodiola kirilowii]
MKPKTVMREASVVVKITGGAEVIQKKQAISAGKSCTPRKCFTGIQLTYLPKVKFHLINTTNFLNMIYHCTMTTSDFSNHKSL